MLVCLASTSPARRALLLQTGIDPRLESPGVDEERVIADLERARGAAVSPAEHVQVLATAKARAVARRLAEEGFTGLVIGGDSMFVRGERVFGKPHTAAAATARWQEMRGRTGELFSGHCVIRVGSGAPAEAEAVATARVSFAADVTDAEIAAYVATGEPLEVAGAFTVDGRGAGFIERVEGDPSTVVGMSLSTVRRLARELGAEWTALWSASA
ncbi:nucleoside triphosphate pyrophosphatase [Microbacterium sp. ZXX196]|uniref:Maf family protein n=1 Tax=Microbacterium sp. ZXX196 TaxID=2609291 RepID=UPI0012BA370D|nr:Maf family protein [Microbacterium sp. ZXX196]MTE22712.1 septum formation inhibitor Maf [Microbacterium sp. ZXX196]